MNLLSILFPQTVYKTTSDFSAEIKVIDHVFERRLVVGGLTQSGGILTGIWKKALDQQLAISNWQLVKNVLILGLGAGTVAQVISEKIPDAKIIGVEIDPEIIDTGKKYFHLGGIKNLEIIIEDAINFINHELRTKNHGPFDLIIVDLYKGYAIEKAIKNDVFLQKIGQNLAKNGFVIFNVLTGQNGNFEAEDFLDKLQGIFKDYFCKRIVTNTFFFCAKYTPKGGDLSMAKKKKKKR